MVKLEQAQRAERFAALRGQASDTLHGPALAREIGQAVRTYRDARRLSEHEQDALAQMVAERISRRHLARRHGRAADVLAWIDRAERMPTIAAREECIPRGDTGRNHVWQIVAGLMRDSREWRDTAGTYRTAAQRQADHGPMVESVENANAGYLAIAAAREAARRGEVPAVIAEHAADIASDAAALIGGELALTPRQSESVRVALLAGYCGQPLAAVGESLGMGLALAKARSAEGARILREQVGGTALVDAVRQAAAPLLTRSLEAALVRLSRGEPALVAAMLCPLERAACERAGWTPEPHPAHGHALPDLPSPERTAGATWRDGYALQPERRTA